MRWLFPVGLVGILLAACASDAPTAASAVPSFTATTTFVGVATNGKDVVIPFITNRAGDLTVSADWTPKSDRAFYVLRLFSGDDVTDASNLLCSVYKNVQPDGHYVCALTAAPAGGYTVVFIPGVGAGQTPVAITVTGETD